MKRFLWALPTILLVFSASAFADSIIIGLSPNNGSGDNFGFALSQPGFAVGIGGGTPVDFFNDQGYAPGSDFGGTTAVFFSSGSVQIGDNTYDLGFSGPGTLFVSSFTFPTTGKNLSIQVQADFSVSAFFFDAAGQFQTISIGGGAPGTMTFNWNPSLGLFFANPVVFSTATVTPEPATFGLMATGLLSMLALARRKLRT